MINLNNDQYTHLRKNVFPSLSGKKYSSSELYIQERDVRLSNFLMDKMDVHTLDPESCTLDLRTRAIAELNAPDKLKVLEETVHLVGCLREWGIVTEGNENLPLMSILFKWAAGYMHYATLNAPRKDELYLAIERIILGLGSLAGDKVNADFRHDQTIQSLDSICRAIEECIPEEEGKGSGYSERFNRVLTDLDSNDKRWTLKTSPWLIEHWADRVAPFSSSREGFTTIYRCFPIKRSKLEPLVSEHSATTLKIWSIFVTHTLDFFNIISVNNLYAKVCSHKILGYLSPEDRRQFLELANLTIELGNVINDGQKLGTQILETIVKEPVMGKGGVAPLLNPLGNIIKAMIERFGEIQTLIAKVYRVQEVLSSHQFRPENSPFDREFRQGVMMGGCFISLLSDFITDLFGWSIAAEQQVPPLSLDEQLDFLPPHLRPKRDGKAKGKEQSDKHKKVKPVSTPKKVDSLAKSRKIPKMQPPKHSKPLPKLKLPEIAPMLHVSGSVPTDKNRQIAVKEPSLPLLPLSEKREGGDKDYARPFASLLNTRDPEAIKVASHADLNYNLLSGISLLNQAAGPNRQDELLFISKSAMHTVNLFMEAGIKYASIEHGSVVQGISHNLWPSFRKLNIRSGERTIKRHYIGSYWSRFSREQIQGWTELAKSPPKLLRKIIDLSNGSPQALSRSQKRVDKWIKEAFDFNRDLIKNFFGKSPTLSLLNMQHIQTGRKIPAEACPWLPLINEVEKMNGGGNVWVSQWLDELKALSGAWNLIGRANTFEEHAAMVSAVHGLLHAVVQAPLYSLQVAKRSSRVTGHRLEFLWKEVFGFPGKPMPLLIQTLLNEASVASRYPFNFTEPQSGLHHLQLESIALLTHPEIESGFLPARGKAVFAADSVAGLKNIRTLANQKEALKSACVEIAQMIARDLVPEVRNAITPVDFQSLV